VERAQGPLYVVLFSAIMPLLNRFLLSVVYLFFLVRSLGVRTLQFANCPIESISHSSGIYRESFW
jgi:hypothetical protein